MLRRYQCHMSSLAILTLCQRTRPLYPTMVRYSSSKHGYSTPRLCFTTAIVPVNGSAWVAMWFSNSSRIRHSSASLSGHHTLEPGDDSNPHVQLIPKINQPGLRQPHVSASCATGLAIGAANSQLTVLGGSCELPRPVLQPQHWLLRVQDLDRRGNG
ncbi:hypothetical protein F4780DRAFT_23099 [Xylariomycetidae sp. FL0641]|nr:hypothetical protein F4780DRAFT_23099 [Xylariomycetidae sp. FL0641]